MWLSFLATRPAKVSTGGAHFGCEGVAGCAGERSGKAAIGRQPHGAARGGPDGCGHERRGGVLSAGPSRRPQTRAQDDGPQQVCWHGPCLYPEAVTQSVDPAPCWCCENMHSLLATCCRHAEAAILARRCWIQPAKVCAETLGGGRESNWLYD